MTHTRDILNLSLLRISIKISAKNVTKFATHPITPSTHKSKLLKNRFRLFLFSSLQKKNDSQYKFVHTFIIPNE